MVESFGLDVKGSCVGLIFWIDENTFATSLIERVLKGQGLDFYTVKDVEDFVYLIHDLRPQIVVVDAPTVLRDLELFKKQYQESQSFLGAKVVVLDGVDELDFIVNRVGELRRPFDPFKLKEFFSQF